MQLASYAERFERYAATLPQAQRAARRAQFERFLAAGFPTPRLETWHYTDLTPLAQSQFDLAGPVAAELPATAFDGIDQLVYINGRLDRARSTAVELHSDTPAGALADDGVTALNGAFASGG